jgi:hypothetical protein
MKTEIGGMADGGERMPKYWWREKQLTMPKFVRLPSHTLSKILIG